MTVPRARKPARRKKIAKIEAKAPAASRKAAPRKAVARKIAPRKSSVHRVKAVKPVVPAVETPAVIPQPAPSPVLHAASPSISVAPRRMPWRSLAAFFVFALAMSAVGGFIINTVDAATFQGPSQAPPGGNIPITIWNRVASTVTQTSAAIAIDGGGPGPTTATGLTVGLNVAGNDGVNLGSAAGGQNVLYGVANYANMNSADYLLLLQTVAAGPTFQTRFTVNRDGLVTATSGVSTLNLTATNNLSISNMSTFGSATRVLTGTQNLIYGNVDTTTAVTASLLLLQNESVDRLRVDPAGNVTASGKMKSASCFGKTFVGITVSVWPGNVGSYYAADNRCNADFPGSHVCRVEELIESIQCSVAGDPVRVNEGNVAWVNGGPPGDSAVNANDCIGWTSNGASSYGRVWIFNNTTGGRGTLTGCNVGGGGLKFACCR